LEVGSKMRFCHYDVTWTDWLLAHDRVRFKVAVLMYKATHGTAPSYLSPLVRVADLPGRCSLSPAGAVRETVYRQRQDLPSRRTHHLEQSADNVISAPSLSTFLCSRPRSFTLSSIPLNYSPTFSGSWSDFITGTTLLID